jgi:pimeloyl-ACP methyl ester carboxylesterase
MSLAALVALAVLTAGGVWIAYTFWERNFLEQLSESSQVINTAKGPVEYAAIGSGTPRLFIHGTPGGYDQGLIQARAAPDSIKGTRIISVSRPGYLRTPIASGRTPAEQADLYAALLDELNIDRAVIYGGSGGAPSAVQFALRHPDRTIALLLVVPLLTDLPGTPMSEQASSWSMKLTDIITWLTAKFAISAIVSNLDVNNERQMKASQLMVASVLPTRMRRPGQQNDSVEFRSLKFESWPLEDVTVPTLLIHGDADANAPYEGSVAAAARIPGSKLVTLEGGDHFIVLTEAERILEQVDAFLDAQSGP